jgi:hypothetical protein
MIEDKQVVYNTSEDDWTHADEAVEQVLENKLADMEEIDILESDSVTLFKGTVNKVNFDHYVDVTSILDTMSEWAYDDNEFAEGYLDDVTEEQKKDLNDMICSWAEKHNISPKFFIVGDVEEVEVELTDKIKKDTLL